MSRNDDVKTARKKGFVAAAATGGAAALMVAGATTLGVLALVPAAYLGYDWFKYRAKHGLYF